MTDEQREIERLRQAFLAPSEMGSPTESCPPAEQIWDAAHNELNPAELRQTLQHVSTCTVCTEAWQIAREVSDTHGQQVVPAPKPSFQVPRWAAAAALVLAAGALFVNFDPPIPTASTARQAGSSATGLALTSPTDGLSRSNCYAEWTSFEDATYDVVVSTDTLERVEEFEGLREPRIDISEEALASVGAEELRIYVKVRRDGEPIPPNTFHLTCPAQ